MVLQRKQKRHPKLIKVVMEGSFQHLTLKTHQNQRKNRSRRSPEAHLQSQLKRKRIRRRVIRKKKRKEKKAKKRSVIN
jgi:hypothetical protein